MHGTAPQFCQSARYPPEANPCRIVLKKVVLTGQVFRTHKRQAIVRFMFYDEKDINWFKPVELYTKLGHSGRILPRERTVSRPFTCGPLLGRFSVKRNRSRMSLV